MLQRFSRLEELIDLDFEREEIYKWYDCKSLLVEENFKTEDQVWSLTDFSAAHVYYSMSFGRQKSLILDHIDKAVAGVDSRTKLEIIIEPIYIKIGNLRKHVKAKHQTFIQKFRESPDTYKNTPALMVYTSLEWTMNELFQKVESAYGYLLPNAVKKQFAPPSFITKELRNLLRKPFDEDFEKSKKELREMAFAKNSLKEAISFLITAKASFKAPKINSNADDVEVDPDIFPDNSKRLLEWLEVELAHLKELAEHYQGEELIENKKKRIPKLKTSFTVSQLALLVDLCYKEKIIEGNQTDIEDLFVSVFSSKRSTNVSKDSLHNKISEVTPGDMDALKSALSKLMNAINAKQNKDKGK